MARTERFSGWTPLMAILFFPRDLYTVFANKARYPALLYGVWAMVIIAIGASVNLMHHGHGFPWQMWFGVFIVAGAVHMLMHYVQPSSWWRWALWMPRLGIPGAPINWSITRNDQGTHDTVLRGAFVQDLSAGVQAHDDFRMNIKIGGVPLNPRVEPQHFLIAGTTGAGKSQAINAMLRTVRERQQPAIVADVAGGYLQRFGRPQGNDLVLNPFDARDAGWSPFLELRADYDCERLARSAIPDAEGDGAEWAHYAQTLLASCLRSLWRADRPSVQLLLHLMMAADAGELGKVVQGTPAAPLTARGNEKMLASVRAIASAKLGAWHYLPDHGTFAVRDWVRAAGEDGYEGWLYLTYRDDQAAMLRSLVATWLDLSIIEGLSLPENPDRRVWYVMDELDSLGKVGSLRDGLTKLRKFGGAAISGIQTIAQLRATYGEHTAQTLLAVQNTRLIMRASDQQTAEYFEKELGQQEVRRFMRTEGSGSTSGGGTTGGGTSQHDGLSEQRTMQSAVLASEIASLPDLTGYLTTPSFPIRKVSIEYVGMPKTAEPFIAKDGSTP